MDGLRAEHALESAAGHCRLGVVDPDVGVLAGQEEQGGVGVRRPPALARTRRRRRVLEGERRDRAQHVFPA